MKVLIAADVLGAENNGTTIAAMNLYRYLKSQGVDVRVICADQDKKEQKDFFVVPLKSLFPFDWIRKINNVELAKADKKIIAKALEGVDVVHIMQSFSLGNSTAKMANKLNIPIIAGFHCQAENVSAHLGFLFNSKLFNHLVYKTYYHNLYKRVDAIHYPTQFIRDVFEKEIKKSTNGYVISNGVRDIYRHKEVVRPDNISKYYNILTIGRISREKSQKILLKAIKYSQYKNQIQLIIAGQGPYKNSILKLAKKYGLRTPIINFYPCDELINIINSSDLYVHPASVELEGIACLEAISCGLVPILSDSKKSATRYFTKDERNLFHANDPKHLAKQIDYWIGHPNEKEKMKEAYADFANSHRQDECMKKMLEMIKQYARKECHKKKPIVYYHDELNDDFAKNNIKTKDIDDNFSYVHERLIYRIAAFVIYYIIAKPIVRLINKIKYHQKIIDRSDIKTYQKGLFIYANHTTSLGDAFTPNLLRRKKNYIVAGPDTFSIKGIKTLVQMLGAFPIPKNDKMAINYLKAIKYFINANSSITIYPEAHIWPYYNQIRPFKSDSFRYPVNMHSPVYVITNTYQKRKYGKKSKLTSYIDGPFYPDPSLPRKEQIEDLRNKVYEHMKNVAEQYSTYSYINYVKIDD